MGEARPVPAHGVVNLRLAERVGQVIVAADHVGDGHVVVIDDHGVLIGRRAVAAQDDHVVQLGVCDPHRALHEVPDHRLALARRLQPNGGCDAAGASAGSRSRQRPS